MTTETPDAPAEATLSPQAPLVEAMPTAPRLHGPMRQVLRALVVLVLIGFMAYILQEAIRRAFLTNPGLNGLILGVLGVGILLSLVEFFRLSRAAREGTRARRDTAPDLLSRNALLAPLAGVFRHGASSSEALEAVSIRLDEGRETLRYLAGLLVFLGLLGTFWGLLDTVSSVGNVIKSLRTGSEAGAMFDDLKSGLAAPLSGMGLSFSSSLFGIAGSLVLGFLDLQVGQAQRRLRTEIEDWLADVHSPALPALAAPGAPAFGISELTTRLDKIAATLAENGSGRQSAAAMANLAEGIQGLVQHMRGEQQLIRDWVEAQASRDKDMKRLLDRLAERERLL